VRWLWRNLRSLLPRRRFNPWRYGSDPHTSPWDNRINEDELKAVIDSGETDSIKGLPRGRD
jgi:hypothetical protein